MYRVENAFALRAASLSSLDGFSGLNRNAACPPAVAFAIASFFTMIDPDSFPRKQSIAITMSALREVAISNSLVVRFPTEDFPSDLVLVASSFSFDLSLTVC